MHEIAVESKLAELIEPHIERACTVALLKLGDSNMAEELAWKALNRFVHSQSEVQKSGLSHDQWILREVLKMASSEKVGKPEVNGNADIGLCVDLLPLRRALLSLEPVDQDLVILGKVFGLSSCDIAQMYGYDIEKVTLREGIALRQFNQALKSGKSG